MQERFGQPLCAIICLFRLHFARLKSAQRDLDDVFSRPNPVINHRGSVRSAALLGRYQSHEGADNFHNYSSKTHPTNFV